MMGFRDKGFVLATVLMLIWVSSNIVANPGQSTQLSLWAGTDEPVVGESIVLEGYLESTSAGVSGRDIDIHIDDVKVYTVQTDDTGYYGVMTSDNTAGTHTFQAKFSGDGAYDPSESPKVDVTWQAAVKASESTCTQTVKVKNKDTGADMPHIMVEARPDAGGTIIKCTTNDYGECELDLTEGEGYTVVANWLSFPPDYECHPVSDCEESITACDPGLKTFRLKNTAPLPCDQPVIVINKDGGLGIEDVNVIALQYGVSVGGCLTGGDGRCTIPGLNRDEMYDIAVGTHSNVYECESIGDCEYNMLRACEGEITLKLRGSLINDPFNSVWAETFMITPRLEDNKNNWGWTKTGYSNLYDGGGFDRADACELRCDGQRECNLFEGCTLFEGNSGQCSNCEEDQLTANDVDCTHDSEYDEDGDPCPGEPHDCYKKICKQDAVVGLFYSFDADLVFIIDTSGSMDTEWKSLCSIMSHVVSKLEEGGINVKYDIYGLGSRKACSTGYIPIHSESWGPGTEDKAKNYPWRHSAKRIIFPVSDEGAHQGDSWNSADDASITAAIAAAKNQDPPVTVFGLYAGSNSDVISGMERLSTETGGTAHYFSNKDAVAEAIISAVGTCPDYFTKIYRDMYSRKWSSWEEHKPTPPQPEKRMFCSLEGAVEGVTTFSIPDIAIERFESTEDECGWYETCPEGWNSEKTGPQGHWCCPSVIELPAEPVVSDEHVWKIEHPAFTVIETGNMPFEVLGPELEISGDEYMIKRVYLPKPTNPHTHQDEFIVKSELVLAYTLLESVGGSVDDPAPFEIIATHSYRSMILRDTYYVACEHRRCQGRCTCCDCSCMDGECP